MHKVKRIRRIYANGLLARGDAMPLPPEGGTGFLKVLRSGKVKQYDLFEGRKIKAVCPTTQQRLLGRISDAELGDFCRLYEQGLSCYEISAKSGRSVCAVRRILRKSGRVAMRSLVESIGASWQSRKNRSAA